MSLLDRFQPLTRKEELDAEQAHNALAESQSADPILNCCREQQRAAELRKPIMDDEDAVTADYEQQCRGMLGRIRDLETQVNTLRAHLNGRTYGTKSNQTNSGKA